MMRNPTRPALLACGFAGLLTLGAAGQQNFSSAGPQNPSTSNVCGDDPDVFIRNIFTKVSQAAGLQFDGNRGFDSQSGMSILFAYVPGSRLVSFDCERAAPQSGQFIATTTDCGRFFAETFGFGVCEAAQTEDEAASVVSHELSHLVLRHVKRRIEYMEGLFQDWFQSPAGQAEYQSEKDEEDRKIEAQIFFDHPELSSTRDPHEIEFVMGPYQEQAAGVIADTIWAKFLTLKQPELNAKAQTQESEADKNGIYLLKNAGYNPHAAADMMDHYAQLRGALDLKVDLLHPPPTVRQQVLRQLAAQLDAGAPSP